MTQRNDKTPRSLAPSRKDSGADAELDETTDLKKVTKELQNSERQMAAILDTVMDAVITISEDGIVQTFNAASEKMFGYTAEEMIGNYVNMLMPEPYRGEHDNYIRRYLDTGEAHVIGIDREVTARRKDGTTFPISLVINKVDHMGFFTGILRDLSETRALQQEILEIATKEQQRISEDLHDGIGQELTGIALMSDGLLSRIERIFEMTQLDSSESQKLHDIALRINEGAQRARKQLRKAVKGLAPFDEGSRTLALALKHMADMLNEWNNEEVIADVDTTIELQDVAVATNIYRIAQESANNALKHAKACHVQIVLKRFRNDFVLEVTDDGEGIASENTAPDANSGGAGLEIMKHRARLVGATLTVTANQDSGTKVRCVFQDRPPLA